MTASNIHLLHARPSPLAPFLRVGHTGQHRLEALVAANRMPYQRFVFDAAHIRRQQSLLQAFKARGAEIVIDLNFAETAAPGRFATAVAKLPWGNAERPWTPDDFGRGRNADFYKQMAEFAVANGATAVLAPTHLVESELAPWRTVDLDGCVRLRQELDRAGGKYIAIDYQMITTTAALKDSQLRSTLLDGIADLPFQNLWLRASGFGAKATGAGTRHLLETARHLHAVGRPVVIDMAGGFAGLSTLAFGTAGGICHGVALSESFNAADWRKPPQEGKGGGLGARIYVADLDRHLSEKQAEAFFAVRGTKSRFACNDTSCCPSGLDDMAESPQSHFITQRFRQIAELDRLPEARRAEHFLLRMLDPAVRSARQAAKLKFGDEQVQKLVGESKSRLIRFRDALGALHEAEAVGTDVSRSRAPAFRGGQGDAGGVVTVLGGRR